MTKIISPGAMLCNFISDKFINIPCTVPTLSQKHTFKNRKKIWFFWCTQLNFAMQHPWGFHYVILPHWSIWTFPFILTWNIFLIFQPTTGLLVSLYQSNEGNLSLTMLLQKGRPRCNGSNNIEFFSSSAV